MIAFAYNLAQERKASTFHLRALRGLCRFHVAQNVILKKLPGGAAKPRAFNLKLTQLHEHVSN